MAIFEDTDEAWTVLMGDRMVPRWTQDSPIRPSVWYEYLTTDGPVSLLLTPLRDVSTGELCGTLRGEGGCPPVIYNQSAVASSMSFEQMLRHVLPVSRWWRDVGRAEMRRCTRLRESKAGALGWIDIVRAMSGPERRVPLRSSFYSFLHAVGVIWLSHQPPDKSEGLDLQALAREPGGGAGGGDTGRLRARCLEAGYVIVRELIDLRRKGKAKLFAVSVNRPATIASLPSAQTIKADAARRVFDLDFKSIHWAILDTGIDVTHPAFANLDKAEGEPSGEGAGKHRVIETYDFTRLERIMTLAASPDHADHQTLEQAFGIDESQVRTLRADFLAGREVDWDLFSDALRVNKPEDLGALHPHGTHVAGILGAGPYQSDDDDLKEPEKRKGMCPNIRLIDVRVLDEHGQGDEFSIIAALQFIRHRNAHKERPVIQGVNLSLQLRHDVRNYACGQTPLCEEVDRLAGAGVVAVAAAGNMGFGATGPQVAKGGGGYQDISIMDPGNADTAITVGATHATKPHTYGVSYFSGRGPTGDGRVKPDIVAPGEKIVGPVPGGGSETMDGTSQAAPHVSAAAAMLMARNNELIGHPQRIKQILCDTATDLERERYFQGRGLVDVLRALQSI